MLRSVNATLTGKRGVKNERGGYKKGGITAWERGVKRGGIVETGRGE